MSMQHQLEALQMTSISGSGRYVLRLRVAFAVDSVSFAFNL